VPVWGLQERFSEEAYLRRVSDESLRGRAEGWDWVIVHGSFKVRSKAPGKHFNLLPKQLMQIMDEFDVDELELGFSRGRWREEWGLPFRATAPGVELWALFRDQVFSSQYGEEDAWKRLTRALSGISCASLEALGTKSVVSPFRMFGIDAEELGNRTLKYGQLSSEAVCTENLTPWLKLLPCRSRAGIASSLVPTTIFQSDFHSFNVRFRRAKTRDGTYAVELALSITMVLGRVPKAEQDIFKVISQGKGFPTACALASESIVYFEKSDRQLQMVDLRQTQAGALPQLERITPERNRMKVKRFNVGSGRVKGGCVTMIKVLEGNQTLKYMEIIPSYLRVRPSSISLKVNEKPVPLWRNDRYAIELSERAGPPGLLQLEIDVHAGDEVMISFGFHQDFLPLWSFPPDPNRGFDIPAGLVQFRLRGEKAKHSLVGNGPGRIVKLYTDPLLVSMPLPDFSMPYNVITLSSTIMAFLFGSVVSALVDKVQLKHEEPTEEELRKRKWRERLKNGFFVFVLAAAWLFENDRDTFDMITSQIHHKLASILNLD